ncbi:hypothetical protein ID866_10685 [Astraeus odoratus]|nr:hypothetical protein ID866_10685 [Astraeus odoratus]
MAEFMRSAEYSQLGVVARGIYSLYDAEKMEGLPVGVQVVGRRLEEEAVLAGMRVVVEALSGEGGKKTFNGGKLF